VNKDEYNDRQTALITSPPWWR